MTNQALLQEQIEYYRARAGEYDEWFLRQGRYDRGPDLNGRWHAEAARVRVALAAFRPRGSVLELACGTGLWTQHLVEAAGSVTAVDASPEMLEVNQARVGSPRVRYVQADLFAWEPDRQYDVVFFSFWLSHVPLERFVAFWDRVRSALSPGGRVFFLDSLFDPSSTAADHHLSDPGATTLTRRLNDGREFQIVKVFYDPQGLTRRLQGLGWRMDIRTTDHFFLYGWGEAA